MVTSYRPGIGDSATSSGLAPGSFATTRARTSAGTAALAGAGLAAGLSCAGGTRSGEAERGDGEQGGEAMGWAHADPSVQGERRMAT